MSRVHNMKWTTPTAATGRQNSPHQSLGEGIWEILTASVSVSHTGGPEYAQKCHITYREELGDGSLRSQNLASGYVAPDSPFVLGYRAICKGPGAIFSVVNQQEANIHEFQLTYRRVYEWQ